MAIAPAEPARRPELPSVMHPGRIALVTPGFWPAIGGVERHVEMLGRGLARRGIEVEVITTDPGRDQPTLERRDNFLIRRFPTVAGDSVFQIAPRLGWWLAKNANRFALIHAHSYHTPVALQAAVACHWSSVPLLVTTHYHGVGHSRLRRRLHAPYRIFGAWMLRQAEAVICVSNAESTLLVEHFGDRLPVTVIPNGVDVDEVTAARPRDRDPSRPLVLVAGRLEPNKEVNRLVSAMALLPNRFRLAIAGDGPARGAIAGAVKETCLADRVELLGQLTRLDLLEWFRTADVFVSLSRHEAFGLTVMEAAAGGCRLVLSDIPAHRELAGYFPPNSVSLVPSDAAPAAVADAIGGAASLGRLPSPPASP
ncbi:MAG: glycosyltransferase family 4 protein, partial [Candidatus Dormibacteraeota bacterium]|nr:glycosyltransferase family 4 protein [Candidatus Dormibacteraeota bacterium]